VPFTKANNNLRRIANVILAIDAALYAYAYYLLSAKAKTMAGPGAFASGTDLCLPVLWWGMGLVEWRSKNSLAFGLVCLAMLLFLVSSPLQSSWLSAVAWTMTVAGLIWGVAGKKLTDRDLHGPTA
jgi:hypothetical protein